MDTLILISEDPFIIELLIKFQEAKGFVVIRQYNKRARLFGPRFYYAEMQVSKKSIEKQIQEAIQEENYELAAKLTQEKNNK